MKTVRVRIEWGVYVTYLKQPSQMPRIDWSGSLRVTGAKVLRKERYDLDRIGFGPASEVRREMIGNHWQSRPRNEIEGILLELRPSAAAKIHLKFKWGAVSFTLAELKKKLLLEWPVGPKHRAITLRVSLADVDPLEVGFADDPLPEAAPPKPEVVIDAKQFRDARCFFSYFRREPAWIQQLQKASAEFTLKRGGRRHLALWLMLGPPYPRANSERSRANRWMRFEVLINGRSLGVCTRYFTFFRAGQKVEEIALEIPRGILRRGKNTLTVRNHDHCYHLLVIKAGLHARAIEDSFSKVKLPAGYYCGVDTNTVASENREEFKKTLSNIHSTGLGNYALLRPEGSLIHREDIDEWIDLMKRKGISFTYLFDEASYTTVIQEKAGSLFLGQMYHEISDRRHDYAYPQLRQYRRPTMQTAHARYMEYVGNLVQRVKQASPKTKVILGEANQFTAIEYLAGADIVLAEVNTGHVGLLLAEARGAHRALRKKLFGAHVAGCVIKFPALNDIERLYETTLYACYLHGVHLVYDEESALTQIHGRPYSLQSRFCRGRRALLARYNEFVAQHGDPGKPIIPLALMNGRFEFPLRAGFGTSHASSHKAWEHFGGDDTSWNLADPEFGWRLIDNFLPGVWLPGAPKDWKKVHFWHSGAPFGQFDIIPCEADAAAMRKYRSIIFPGWNSMDRELYRKLVSYVKSGGKLFMTLPQLSTRVDRGFIEKMDDLKLINGGDLSELFGVKVKLGGSDASKVHLKSEAGLFPRAKSFKLTPPLRSSSVKLCGAEVLASDQRGGPVVVQHHGGKGVARLMTLREYPGAGAAKSLMSALWRALATEARGPAWVEDVTGEVAWYSFRKNGHDYLWLHNTDWTVRRNEKHVKVHLPSGDREVTVPQGKPVCLNLKS